MNKVRLVTSTVIFTLLSGCLSMNESETVNARANTTLDVIEKDNDEKRYIISDKPFFDVTPIYRLTSKYQWLKDIKNIEIKESDNSEGVPLSEVIKQFKSSNINISTMLPTHLYNYKGFSISKTNALTALEIITSSMDLDFIVRTDTGEPFVELLPLSTSSYTLNVPNREVNFALTDNSFAGDSDLKQLLSGGGQSSSGGQSGANDQSSSTGGDGENRTSTTIKNEFWKDLNKELKELLTRFVPSVSSKGIGSNSAGGQPMMGANAFELLTPVLVGSVVTNATTGHITIQAPSNVRKEVMEYLEVLDKKLNTRIELNGKIVIVSDSEDEKKGLDISSFIEFGKDYGLVVSNDIYNQITITKPNDAVDYFSAAVDKSFGNALGIVGNEGLLQVFNAYVEANSNIKSVYDPRISGTSGSISTYSRVTPYIFTNFQSGSVTNESSTTQTEQNNLIPIDFGITINAFPIYNPKTDVIRTYIDLVQVFQSTVQTITQSINGEIVSTSIPIPDKVTIKTEIVGKNGALIIVGGQDVESYEGTIQGIPKLKDSYLGGIFGSSTKAAKRSKYYFVFEAKAIDPITSAL